MKKIIGWILIIIGVLAFIGGLTSSGEKDPLVSVMTFLLKIGMIIGGVFLVNSKKQSKNRINENVSLVNPEKNRNIQNQIGTNDFQYKSDNSKADIKNRIFPFIVKNIEGFNEFPDEVIEMNKTGYFKKLYDNTKNDPSVNPEMLIRAELFFIPDNISMFKMAMNQQYDSNDRDPNADKFVSPSFKLFIDNPGLKSYIYPSWFYAVYPDIAMWLIKGEGNKIMKSEFINKLDYLKDYSELDLLKEFIDNEFYKNQNSENSGMKIKPEHLRELINLFKSHNSLMALECEAEA